MADLREQLRAVWADLDADIATNVLIAPQWDENGAFRLVAGAGSRLLRPIQFKRYRAKSGDDGGRRLAGAFRLVFPNPVRGPIILGWSSHFGMGSFVPRSDAGG